MLTATPQILDDLDCYLPDNEATDKIARFFALLSDPSRVKLLSALAIAPLLRYGFIKNTEYESNDGIAPTKAFTGHRGGKVRQTGENFKIQNIKSEN